MLRLLAQNWWLFVLQGVLAILFGVAAYLWPGRALGALITLFGVYATLDGILVLIRAFRAAALKAPWWPFLLQGLVSLGAGVGTLAWPGLTALLLVYCIGSWALIGGVLQVVAGIKLRDELEGEWTLIVSGILSAIFGLWMIAAPGEGALALVWLIAGYAIVLGIAAISAGLRLRAVNARLANLARPSQA